MERLNGGGSCAMVDRMSAPPSLRSKLASLIRCLATLVFVSTAPAATPNILLIIADDLGADSFPLTAGTGASLAPMPNLTALKSRGVLFINAHAHPTCSPSRAAMLTGRHPFRTGIGAQLTDATSPQLQAGEFTLPEAFAANAGLGYSLKMFGKWHLTSGAGANDTARSIGGWPSFAGTISGALADYYSWTKVIDGVASTSTTYATTDIANDVVSWIDARGTTPWMAWVALNAPHAPFHSPPSGLHTYNLSGTPSNRTLYEAACQALDTEVGRILDHVDFAKTNVIFIGDNGTPGQVIQTPYNSAHSKETLYEGGTRVPLIIAGASVANQDRVSTAPVHCVDLYSTILGMAGISLAATQPAANVLDSNSLMPILKNTAEGIRYAFSQEFSSALSTSVSGRALTSAAGYKLIQFDDGREEFYRTTTDSNEATSLLGASISAADQSAYGALKLKLGTFQAAGTPAAPLLSSWFTKNSGRYARLYQTIADQNAGATSTTWSRGAGVQTTPTYAGIHEIDYSASWVYIRTTGLASCIMGPWYLNAAKTNLFPNCPCNTASVFRFPRTPSVPPTKTLFGGGNIGYFLDGVSIFDIRDAFYWNGSADVSGSGNWNRDAYVNESVTFDNAGAHQAGSNYHRHASSNALRHLVGDHVDYQAATNTYTESASTTLRHSPIVGWLRDGLPMYGPYGYSDPMDASSPVRRMIGGYALRNGQNGTTNLTMTGRTTLPAWAVRAYGVPASQSGPPVSGTYPLGRYLEDNEYLGDLGYTQGTHFDLNEYNVRYCKTPEFPEGTWAYFLCIAADGTPVFPYQVGRSYYGDPTGGALAGITEPVTTTFMGGPFKTETAGDVSVNTGNGNVSITWNAVEGGIYLVESSPALGNWSPLATGVIASGSDTGNFVESGAALANGMRFYRVGRTGLSAYDRAGFAGTTASGNPTSVAPGGAATAGSTVDVTITLTPPPNVPPTNVLPTSVTLAGTISGSALTRPSATTVKATFAIPANAPQGAQTIVVTFPGPSYTLTGAFTIQ